MKKTKRKWTVLSHQPTGEPKGFELVALSKIILNRTPAVGEGLLGRIVTNVHPDLDPPTVIVEEAGSALAGCAQTPPPAA